MDLKSHSSKTKDLGNPSKQAFLFFIVGSKYFAAGGINIIPIHLPGCPIVHRLSSTSSGCTAPPWIAVPEIDRLINGVSIYPNPAKDRLYVDVNSDLQEEIKIQICDYTGRYLSDPLSLRPSHDKVEIDLSRFTNGIYIIKFTSGGVIGGVKFIKD